MNEGHGDQRRGGPLRTGGLAAALAGTMLLAAACGGGSHPATPGPGAGPVTAQVLDAFAQCMRRHSEPNFYFSQANSSTGAGLTDVLKLGPWAAPADPGSPQFQSAMKACRSLLPIPQMSAAQMQAQLRQQVRQAACMRAHGYPGYPDPSVQNGYLARPQLPAGIDQNSPRFQSTLQACRAG